MKTTILLVAVTFGCITPTYSQLNRHRKMDARSDRFQNETSDQLQNKMNDGFGNYNYTIDKFSDFLNDRERDGFDVLPTRPAPRQFTTEIYSAGRMPCVHPKSGDKMPCLKPTGTFPMRVFKPKDVIWGILW